ncbi:MAG: hypothetical protein CK548_01330 [Opitutia bacterium]|nr:MAG: hypothetical protein CK548_01330 [Opitutae bacterium]
MQVAHVGLKESTGVEQILLDEENAAVFSVELGRKQRPRFAGGEDEGGEENGPGRRARGGLSVVEGGVEAREEWRGGGHAGGAGRAFRMRERDKLRERERFGG